MAYIPKQTQDEDKEKTTTPTSGQPTGTSAGVLSQSAPTGTPTGQNKKQSFATLQSYLKTNKPQGEQFATKLAEGVTATGQQAQQGIEGTKQKLTSDIQGQTINYDPNIVQEAVSNPVQFTQDPNKLETFTKYRTASYGGPQMAEATPEFQKTQADVAKALERSKLTESEGGRKQLASEAQKSQAAGITALNQALLSTNPQAAAKLQAASAPFANLQTALGSSAEEVNARIKAAQEAATAAKTGATENLAPLQTNLRTNLQSKLESARKELDPKVSMAIQRYELGQATPEDLQLLGFDLSNLNDQSLTRAYKLGNILRQEYGLPIDYSTLFTKQAPEFVYSTPESIATPEQFAYEQALEKLAGEQLNILSSPSQQIAPVTPNRSALGQFESNLQELDTKTIMDNIRAIGFSDAPNWTFQKFVQVANESPSLIPAMIERVRGYKGTTEAQKLSNALARMGFNTTNIVIEQPKDPSLPPTSPYTGIVKAL